MHLFFWLRSYCPLLRAWCMHVLRTSAAKANHALPSSLEEGTDSQGADDKSSEDEQCLLVVLEKGEA